MGEAIKWKIITTDYFDNWFDAQNEDLQDSVLSYLELLQLAGPELARPYADTIKGSKYANMKELRIQHCGKPIRAFFAFDPLRQAIVLCAGDKSNDKKFYDKMIRIADNEFTDYLTTLESK